MKLHRPLSACLLAGLVLLPLAAARAAEPGRHPRLLLSADDLPRLRYAAGLAETPGAPAEWGVPGSRAADFQTLREHFARPLLDAPLAGEVLAAAFVAMTERDQTTRSGALAMVSHALQSPDWISNDALELVLALDWCWPELPPETRRGFVLAARERAEPLTPADNPLDARRFRERLFGVMLALAVNEADDDSPSWLAQRQRLLDAARDYVSLTFPVFVRERGLSPTTPAAGPSEESLAALLVDLSGGILGHRVWPEQRGDVGRWLEHYWLETLEHPALNHGFVRESGNSAPLTPAPEWRDLLPVTAALVAARTSDPAAARVALRVAGDRKDSTDASAFLWSWVDLAFPFAAPPAGLKPPMTRNLGGAVVFRGGKGNDATAIWIEAAQPLLRDRQHLDAGHFLIYRGGRLAVSGGDDIALEATSSKRGLQRLGDDRTSFDFDQYVVSSIAHNCLIAWDGAWVAKCGDTPFLPVGGQRCVPGTCTDFKTPLEKQGRRVGRQLAYGASDTAAFLSLDLAAAYDDRAVKRYTRSYVYLMESVLVVIDRVELTVSRSPPTWVLNIPARPLVDGHGLPSESRIAGETNEGGIWRMDDATSLRWTDRDGGLWVMPLSPDKRHIRAVGGPARQLAVPDGPFAGRAYVGGDPNSFERLILPGERRGAQNAWYRLGAPTTLGPTFGRSPHWGRIEIEPATPGFKTTFVTVLVADRADAQKPPTAAIETVDGTLKITIQLDRQSAELTLPADDPVGGVLRLGGPQSTEWNLPSTVQPDALLAPASSTSQPTSRAADN